MSEKLDPLTPALEQAFRDAVFECKHWTRDPTQEPEVYVGFDDCAKISAVCEYILACENKPMPKLTLYPLYDLPDQTRKELKELLDRDASYHAGARCLQVLIKRKQRALKSAAVHYLGR
jgi:hypothetical protein